MKKPSYPFMHMGGYVEDSEMPFNYVLDCAEDGVMYPVGGCCGTLPSHINAVMKKFEGLAPGKLMEQPMYPAMRPSGLQPAFGGSERGFQLIGTRGNLTGAVKFKKLVNAYK